MSKQFVKIAKFDDRNNCVEDLISKESFLFEVTNKIQELSARIEGLESK